MAHLQFKALDLPEIDIPGSDSVDAALAVERPDVMINAAAFTAVNPAEEERDLAFQINVAGPQKLALTSGRIGARLIRISTDCVFDGTACKPCSPNADCNPLGAYCRTRRQGETNVRNHPEALACRSQANA